MKPKILLILLFGFVLSCEIQNKEITEEIEKNPDVDSCFCEENVSDELFDPQINFDISKHLFPGKKVKNIAFNNEGYFYSGNSILNFVSWDETENHAFDVASTITALAFNHSSKLLYIGTEKNGFAEFDGINFKYFNVENSGIPRNQIREVICDCNGNVWCNSSVNREGGLVKYNGSKVSVMLPENSLLPTNLIYLTKTRNGKVYVASANPDDTGVIISEICGDYWTELGKDRGCIISGMGINSEGEIFYLNDSREYCGGGLMLDFVLKEMVDSLKIIHRETEILHTMYYRLTIDLRNYIWLAKFNTNNQERLTVFDGEKWFEAPTFQDIFINCIEVDENNNIWIGTNNGIYILNQS